MTQKVFYMKHIKLRWCFLTTSGDGPDWYQLDFLCRPTAACASTQAAPPLWELTQSLLPGLKCSWSVETPSARQQQKSTQSALKGNLFWEVLYMWKKYFLPLAMWNLIILYTINKYIIKQIWWEMRCSQCNHVVLSWHYLFGLCDKAGLFLTFIFHNYTWLCQSDALLHW